LLDQIRVGLDFGCDGHVHESVSDADGHAANEGWFDGGREFDDFALFEESLEGPFQVGELVSTKQCVKWQVGFGKAARRAQFVVLQQNSPIKT